MFEVEKKDQTCNGLYASYAGLLCFTIVSKNKINLKPRSTRRGLSAFKPKWLTLSNRNALGGKNHRWFKAAEITNRSLSILIT